MFNLLKRIFGRSKSIKVEENLTDEQKYNRWWASQDTPEAGGTKHPKFDKQGKRINESTI